MSKDAKIPNESWEGALGSIFEDDIRQPSDKHWRAVEKEIFPAKNRRFGAFWILLFALLGSIGYSCFEWFSGTDQAIRLHNGTKNVRKEQEAANKTDAHKVKVLPVNESVENLKSRNYSSKSQRNFSRSFERQDKSKNLAQSSDPKMNARSSKEVRLYTSVHETGLFSNAEKKVFPAHENLYEKHWDEMTKKDNFEERPGLIDSIPSLKLLAVQLLPSTHVLDIIRTIEKNNGKFKPYFSFQMAPVIGRNIRMVSGAFNGNNLNSSVLGDRRVSLPKYGFHVGINYHFTKRLSLNTGCQMAAGEVQSRWFFRKLKLESATNDVRLKTTSGEARTADPTLIKSITSGTSVIYKLRLNHSFLLYSIPVGITYRFSDNRFSPYLRTGLNMEFFGKRNLSIDVLEKGMVRNIELNLNRPNHGFSFQALIDVGFEANLKGNWKVFAEAGYFVPLNQFINVKGFSVRMAGSMIMAGLRYDLKSAVSPELAH